MFLEMLEKLKHDVVMILCKVQVQTKDEVDQIEEQRRVAEEKAKAEMQHAQSAGGETPNNQSGHESFVRTERKIGRNEPCPCGSGKKYKQCHGKLG